MAWAALFAVATLLQLPAMAFAATSGSAQQEITSASATQHHQAHQHHQHDHDHHGSAPDAAHDGPSCFAVGCCFALGAAGTSAPVAAYVLLGMLAHAPARTMLPSLPDPTVPPPRLQV